MDIVVMSAWALVMMVAVEVVSFYLIIRGLRFFQGRVELLIPDGASPGKIVSDAMFDFIDGINTDPKKAQIVGTFISNAAEVAMVKAKGSLPAFLGGGGEGGLSGDFMARLEKKNPLAALAVSALQAAAPLIQLQLQQNSTAAPPKTFGGAKKGGVIGYG